MTIYVSAFSIHIPHVVLNLPCVIVKVFFKVHEAIGFIASKKLFKADINLYNLKLIWLSVLFNWSLCHLCSWPHTGGRCVPSGSLCVKNATRHSVAQHFSVPTVWPNTLHDQMEMTLTIPAKPTAVVNVAGDLKRSLSCCIIKKTTPQTSTATAAALSRDVAGLPKLKRAQQL